MPRLYPYRCPQCQGVRELWRAVKDRDEQPTCNADPNCLGTPMPRVLTAPNLKGETVSKS
ncbi:MAG: hypothetical protein NVS4B6_32230 [Mycobacterium sp.]